MAPTGERKNLLQTFTDSDYAANESRRSVMGSVVLMNGGPISWSFRVDVPRVAVPLVATPLVAVPGVLGRMPSRGMPRA
jgi:hypothetical protein